MFSCAGNNTDTTAPSGTDTATEETAPTTEENNTVVDEWTPPTYEELVERLMTEGKVIADFIRDNNFIYGDAEINPAINWRTLNVKEAINSKERIVACDRMVSWILFRAGFIDQDYRHGLNLYRYFEEHDFELIESTRNVKAGDIVFVNPDSKGNPGHVFMCAGLNQRYDGGSNERINGTKGPQPFTEPIGNFVRAYRPNPAKMPNPAMLDIYTAPAEDKAVIAENSTVIFEQPSKEGTLALSHKYEPGKEYSQYEFHLNLKSTSEIAGSTEPTEASFVGVRITDKRKTARDPGGIYLAFNGTKQASLFFGRGGDRYSWNYRPSFVTLPEDFSTAHKLVVVDAGDVIKYYMDSSDGNRYMICSIHLSEEYDQAVVRDHNNRIVYSGSAVVNKDGYFGVWSYRANTSMTDIAIKAS